MCPMVCMKPYINYVMGVVSRFMSNPGKQHQEVVKQIFRYFQDIAKMCLCFRRGMLKLHEYVYANFDGEKDHRRSTIGYVFTLGTIAISWIFQLQKIIDLSTIKVEYVVVKKQRDDLVVKFVDRVRNQTYGECIAQRQPKCNNFAKNLAFHSRTNHIALFYHFINSLLENGVSTLVKMQGSQDLANMFTKVGIVEKFVLCLALVDQRRGQVI